MHSEMWEVRGVGSNSHHQLGHPSVDDLHAFTPLPHLSSPTSPLDIATGANHSLLLVKDDKGEVQLLGAGSNQRGQLDPSSSSFSSLRTSFLSLPLELLLPTTLQATEYSPIAAAACWETSFLVLRPRRPSSSSFSSDVLLSFGANDWGERGVGLEGTVGGTRATEVKLDHLFRASETEVRVEKIKAGPRHVLSLLSFSAGQRLDASSDLPTPLRRLLVGWGASRHGQLGSLPFSSTSPPRMTTCPQPIYLPPGYEGEDVVGFAIGKDHSAVLLEAKDGQERKLWLVGSGKHGQLGVLPSPPIATMSGESSGAMRKTRSTPPNSNLLTAASLLSSISTPSHLPPSLLSSYALNTVDCTWNGTYIVLSSSLLSLSSLAPPPDVLISFGSNSHGQLGSGSSPSPTVSIPSSTAENPSASSPLPPNSLGEPHLVLLPSLSSPSSSSDDSTSHADFSLPIQPLATLPHIAKLACGSEHVLALLSSHPPSLSSRSPNPVAVHHADGGDAVTEIWGWGWNEHGNLGLSSSSPSSSHSRQPPSPFPTFDTVDGSTAGLEDVYIPLRIWPPSPSPSSLLREEGEKRRGRVMGVWAGMATSWISSEVEG